MVVGRTRRGVEMGNAEVLQHGAKEVDGTATGIAPLLISLVAVVPAEARKTAWRLF